MHITKLTSSRTEQVGHSLRHLVEEADQLLKSLARSSDETFDATRDALAEQVRQVRSQLLALEEDALHSARKAARHADRAVHAHPYRAIGIAAAAGLLIGLLAARR